MRFKLATEEATVMKLPTFRSTPSPADVTLREGTRRLRAEALPERGLAKTLSGVGIRQSDGVARSVQRAVKRKKVQRLALATGSCLAVTWWGYLLYADINPPISEPLRIMPKVNAYDTYAEAGAMLQEMPNIDEGITFLSKIDQRVLTVAEAKDLKRTVDANGKVLDLIHLGLDQQYMQALPNTRPGKELQYSTIRTFARLLRLKSEVARGEGRIGEAVDSAIDAVQLGNQVARGAPVIGRLTGNAASATGRATLWSLVDSVDAETAKSAAKRLAQVDSNAVSMTSTLESESDVTKMELQKIFQMTDWRHYFTSITLGDGTQASGSWPTRLYFYRYSKSQFLDAYSQRMQNEITQAEEPPTEATSAQEQEGDIFITSLIPSFSQMKLRKLISSAEDRMLAAEFAKRAYFLEHGQYPASLNDLCPKYLAQVPRDPFRPAQRLGYSLKMKPPSSYSVGPDQVDNGGRSISNRTIASEHRRQSIELSNTGDIVARIDLN